MNYLNITRYRYRGCSYFFNFTINFVIKTVLYSITPFLFSQANIRSWTKFFSLIAFFTDTLTVQVYFWMLSSTTGWAFFWCTVKLTFTKTHAFFAILIFKNLTLIISKTNDYQYSLICIYIMILPDVINETWTKFKWKAFPSIPDKTRWTCTGPIVYESSW